jgi:hypothetical protein
MRSFSMISLEYHKGSQCSRKEILCQEGYCSSCVIFSQTPTFIPKLTNVNTEKESIRLQKVPTK